MACCGKIIVQGVGVGGEDTFGTVVTATAEVITSNGETISVGDSYIVFPDGTTWGCCSNEGAGADTFGTVVPAATGGTSTNGEVYNAGDNIIVFPDGTTYFHPDFVGTDTFGDVVVAAAPLTTTNGVSVAAGESYIEFPNGDTWAFVDTDTFGTVEQATADGVDSTGVAYSAGDWVIRFPDGTSCAKTPHTVDTNTFGTVVTATEAGTSTNSEDYVAGDIIIVFPDGTVYYHPDAPAGTDTFGDVVTAGAPLVTTNGVNVAVGEQYILFPNGDTWNYADTDTFGTVSQATADGVDTTGQPYVAGDWVLVFPDGTTCVKKDDDTFGTVIVNDTGADLTTTNGVTVGDGGFYVVFPDGTTWAFVDTDTNTFGTVVVAAADGTSTNGENYVVGDSIVVFPDGTVYFHPDAPAGTDTFGDVVTNNTGADIVTTNGITVADGEQYVLFPNGDTWDYVDTDTDTFGTVTVNNTGVPFTTTNGVTVADGDQYVVFPDGTTWANSDICTDIAALPTVDCAAATDIVVDCGVVAKSDLIPHHVFGQCSSPAETLTPTGGQILTPPPSLTMTELDRGQLGSVVYHTNPSPGSSIPPGSFPLTIPVPAASPNCVLALHVGYGGVETDSFEPIVRDPSITLSGGADVSAPTQVVNTPYNGIEGGGQEVWLFDPLTGGTGSTVDLDFDIYLSGELEGVVQWYWTEICDPSGQSLSVSNFDIGSAVTVGNGGSTTADEPVNSAPVDFGACSGIYFGGIRHARYNTTSGDGENIGTNSFEINTGGHTEVYDTTSLNIASDPFVCQWGSTAGSFDANVGSFNYTSYNDSNMSWAPNPAASVTFLPINCANYGTIPGVDAESACCAVPLTNTNCDANTVKRCTVRASARICAAAGDTVTLTPKVSGVLLADQAVGVELGADGCVTHAVSFEVMDFSSIIAPGGVSTDEFCFVASGEGTVDLSDWTVTCELIHI